jgi:hypothetical protein
MQVQEKDYLALVDKFNDSFSWSGKADPKRPNEVFESFKCAFEALEGLCAFEQDPEKTKKIRERLRYILKDQMTFENDEGRDERVMLVRDLANAVICGADQCAQIEEWKVTKRTYLKDAGKKAAAGAEVVGGVA